MLAGRLRGLAPDVAICAMPGPLDLLMAAALHRLGIPMVVTVHDADLHPGDGLPLQMALQRALIRRATALVALTGHVANRLRQQPASRYLPLLEGDAAAPGVPCPAAAAAAAAWRPVASALFRQAAALQGPRPARGRASRSDRRRCTVRGARDRQRAAYADPRSPVRVAGRAGGEPLGPGGRGGRPDRLGRCAGAALSRGEPERSGGDRPRCRPLGGGDQGGWPGGTIPWRADGRCCASRDPASIGACLRQLLDNPPPQQPPATDALALWLDMARTLVWQIEPLLATSGRAPVDAKRRSAGLAAVSVRRDDAA